MARAEDNFQPIWDLPLRLFHWTLVGLASLSAMTALVFERALTLHVYAGVLLTVLLLWRLLWGVVGSDTARFSHFLQRPEAAVRYLQGWLRGETERHVGHNPAGGLMVAVMLAALSVQALSGLALSGFGATAIPRALETWLGIGHVLNGYFLCLLVAVHIGAVFAYRLRGLDLLSPMLCGGRPLAPGETPVPVRLQSTQRALALLVGAALVVVLIYSSG